MQFKAGINNIDAVTLVDVNGTPITPLSSTSGTLTNISGAITTGGTAQQIAAANANRKGYWIQNLSANDLWINTIGVATLASPSFKLVAGGYYESPIGGAGNGAISIIGATATQSFSGREY